MLPFVNSQYFQNILESFASAVVIFNSQGRAYALNEQATHMLGKTKDQCLGQSWEVLFEHASATDELRAFMEASHTMQVCPRPVNSRFIMPDGTPLSVSFTGSQLIQNNKLWGIIVTIQDLTHIFELHQREKHLLENFSRLQQEQAESLLQFALAVSHQIRNPIMSIAGFSRRLQDMVQAVKCQPQSQPNHEPDSPTKTKTTERHISGDTPQPDVTGKLDNYADIILDGAQRLESIVEAVSGFTSLTPRERMEASVCELLDKIAEREKKKQSGAENCSLAIVCDNVQAELDVTLFSTALSALLDNAFYAAIHDRKNSNGQVSISAALEDGCLVVRIEDNGTGIQDNIRPFIFDPFYSTKPVGTGMGLCKAQRAVQLMNGELFIISPPNESPNGSPNESPNDSIDMASRLQQTTGALNALVDRTRKRASGASAASSQKSPDHPHGTTFVESLLPPAAQSAEFSMESALNPVIPPLQEADQSSMEPADAEDKPPRCDVSFARAEALISGEDNIVAQSGTAAILRIPVHQPQ